MKSIFKILAIGIILSSLAFTPNTSKLVIIDVSHGGIDQGALIDGFSEKEISLQIAQKIFELNKNSDLEIILNREDDITLTLNDRIEMVNELQPDYLISLHLNSSQNTEVNGVEVFVCRDSGFYEKSNRLAHRIIGNLPTDVANRGIKNSAFHLLRNVEVPSALIELGFMTNELDRSRLTSEQGQYDIAKSILEAIQ